MKAGPRPWGATRLGAPRLSPTRLIRYRRCPRAYFYSHVLGKAEALDGATQKGLNLHAALQALAQAGPLAAASEAEAEAVLAQAWAKEGFSDEASAAEAQAEALGALWAYLKAPAVQGQVLLVERELKAQWGGWRWRGVLDRLDRRAEGLVVVDYKSGRQPPPEDEQRLQLGIYRELVRQSLGEAPVAAEVHHLPSGQAIPLRLSQKGWAEPLEEAEALAAAIAQDRSFAAVLGPHCQRCGHRPHCLPYLESHPEAVLATQPSPTQLHDS